MDAAVKKLLYETMLSYQGKNAKEKRNAYYLLMAKLDETTEGDWPIHVRAAKLFLRIYREENL